jgi:hypothetical protein
MAISVLFVTLIGIQAWLYYQIARRIREHHPHTWVSLGIPDEFAGEPPPDTPQYRAAVALSSFMWRGNVSALGDSYLTSVCNLYRMLSAMTIGAVVLFFLWTAYHA